MTRRKPRWELVTVDGGHFARFVAVNGRIVWVTPGLYAKRIDALRAIELLTERQVYAVQDSLFVTAQRGVREVRTVDERTAR